MLSTKTLPPPAILPDRYYAGFKANPTAFCLIQFVNPSSSNNDLEASKNFMFMIVVGTLQGTIEIVSIEKGAIPKVKFEHKSESQINAIGLISTNSQQSSSTIFVQFRGEEILFFDLKFISETQEIEFVKTKSFSLSHFGFCQSFWDDERKRLFIPGKVDDCESLSILYENFGEKTISLGAEFLFSSFKKRHPETDLTQNDCFNGSISGIKQIKEIVNFEECDRWLIGFEDATLIIYDIRTKEVINLFKAPAKYSQLIAFAVSKNSEEAKWRIAVTVCSRIFEIVYENESFELTKRIKKTGFAGVECSQISYNASGTKLLCGYSSGRIEFYSVPDYTIFKVMNFHESSILCMNVSRMGLTNDIDNDNQENGETLFIGDEDGKVSQMKMTKLEIDR